MCHLFPDDKIVHCQVLCMQFPYNLQRCKVRVVLNRPLHDNTFAFQFFFPFLLLALLAIYLKAHSPAFFKV